MNSKSLKEALAAADAEAPASSGGGGVWEESDYTVEVINSNVTNQFGAPRIGLQLQRSEDSRRRWFDLYFDETNPKAFRMTGLKLKALGLSALIDQLDEVYPEDTEAQLQAMADAMRGIVFVAGVEKRPSNKNTPAMSESEKKYVNYFQVKELIAGPSTGAAPAPAAPSAPPAGGLGGLMG